MREAVDEAVRDRLGLVDDEGIAVLFGSRDEEVLRRYRPTSRNERDIERKIEVQYRVKVS